MDINWPPLIPTLFLVAFCIIAYALFHPRCQLFTNLIFKSAQDKPTGVALTFDDGPHPVTTPAILDILKKHNASATFFLIGQNVEQHPDIVKRILDEGHTIGNHTYHHSYTGLFKFEKYWIQEIQRTENIIHQITGKRTRLFRPPMGFKHRHLGYAAIKVAHLIVTWSRRAYDGRPTTSQKILERLAQKTNPGDIIAMHDGTPPGITFSTQPTVDALEPLLNAFADRNIQITPLPEFINQPAYKS